MPVLNPLRNSFESTHKKKLQRNSLSFEVMKPIVVADEMFPEGPGPFMDLEEAGGSSGLLMDLAANEKDVHADFYNDFEDLFDEDEEAQM
ncbi:COP9 signalosome complex subunit 9 isoform X1 [Anopheles merus]|uniref:COP9 signalosome complex subunit 9 isoform X1 n=2 Tax=Anopheles merus TaxID=30066 RepID=UPI001BE4CAF0|nr:COP9 signalosome complex subunit 9 isoform X1 [Anopheles merus]